MLYEHLPRSFDEYTAILRDSVISSPEDRKKMIDVLNRGADEIIPKLDIDDMLSSTLQWFTQISREVESIKQSLAKNMEDISANLKECMKVARKQVGFALDEEGIKTKTLVSAAINTGSTHVLCANLIPVALIVEVYYMATRYPDEGEIPEKLLKRDTQGEILKAARKTLEALEEGTKSLGTLKSLSERNTGIKQAVESLGIHFC
ncbi:hypothetical protein IG193_00720 [Infirmifilum lucidum]|uniref:Uncharacterized protein n=1 Tax=Infirmifilum lucidum TaxID=2776706 RepID=A0A7L9FJC4_9CREN|nr:hypothetical protein [Infirmifilum lucidum]QOJ79024.1 hypothetical protein IG193_00720 [Infirmifilum lucidum]